MQSFILSFVQYIIAAISQLRKSTQSNRNYSFIYYSSRLNDPPYAQLIMHKCDLNIHVIILLCGGCCWSRHDSECLQFALVAQFYKEIIISKIEFVFFQIHTRLNLSFYAIDGKSCRNVIWTEKFFRVFVRFLRSKIEMIWRIVVTMVIRRSDFYYLSAEYSR